MSDSLLDKLKGMRSINAYPVFEKGVLIYCNIQLHKEGQNTFYWLTVEESDCIIEQIDISTRRSLYNIVVGRKFVEWLFESWSNRAKTEIRTPVWDGYKSNEIDQALLRKGYIEVLYALLFDMPESLNSELKGNLYSVMRLMRDLYGEPKGVDLVEMNEYFIPRVIRPLWQGLANKKRNN